MKDSDLAVGTWWVAAGPRLWRLGIIALLLCAAAFGIFAALEAGRFLRDEAAMGSSLAAMTENAVQYRTVEERIAPAPLVVASAVLVNGAKGKVDVAAVVRNPSEHWTAVSATLTASLDGATLGTTTVSFLPSQERFVAFAGASSSRAGTTATVKVTTDEVTWRRVTADELALPALTVSGAAATILSTQPGSESTQVKGTLFNQSTERLASVTLTAYLYSGSTIVGVGVLTVSDLDGGERRPFDIRLTGAYTSTHVVVEPSFDLAPFVE